MDHIPKGTYTVARRVQKTCYSVYHSSHCGTKMPPKVVGKSLCSLVGHNTIYKGLYALFLIVYRSVMDEMNNIIHLVFGEGNTQFLFSLIVWVMYSGV